MKSKCGPRLSLTFRKLRQSQVPTVPIISQPVSEPLHSTSLPPANPKRLLLLSDSLHLSFPTYLFDQKSVVCIKKRLPNFCLSDLHLFEKEFHYTDYVFISCGVNDLSRYGWSAHKLFAYFRDLVNTYRIKYPQTIFIFNSLLTTEFGWLNSEILLLNNSVFKFSLIENSNVWFFDSHQIALYKSRRGVQVLEKGTRRANGIHITYSISDDIRHAIARCINACSKEQTHVIRNLWPLRPEFRQIANDRLRHT